MNPSGHRRWLGPVVLVGVVYLVVGVCTAALAGEAGSVQLRTAWRLVAWVASAIAYAAHIRYELLRFRSSPATTALHASLAAALGAFLLAAAAVVHSHLTGSGNQRLLRIALVAWPVLTGVPAFLVAWAAAAGLALRQRGA